MQKLALFVYPSGSHSTETEYVVIHSPVSPVQAFWFTLFFLATHETTNAGRGCIPCSFMQQC